MCSDRSTHWSQWLMKESRREKESSFIPIFDSIEWLPSLTDRVDAALMINRNSFRQYFDSASLTRPSNRAFPLWDWIGRIETGLRLKSHMAGPQNWRERFHYRFVLGSRLNTQSYPVLGRRVRVVIDAGAKSIDHPSAWKSPGHWCFWASQGRAQSQDRLTKGLSASEPDVVLILPLSCSKKSVFQTSVT